MDSSKRPAEDAHNAAKDNNGWLEEDDDDASLIRPPQRRKTRDPKMPKRPLSAYNLFFASERERILEERRVNNESRTDLFDNMAKIIGERWRAIDPEQLQRLNAQAQVNSESYRKQMEEYSLRHLKRPPKDIEIVDLPGTSSNEPKSLESFLLEQPYGASFPVSLSAQAYLHSQHFFSPYNPLLATYTYPIDPHYHIWNQLPSHQSPSDALLHYYSVQERLRLGIEMAPSSTSERPGKSAETNKDNDEEAPHSNKEQPS